MGFEDKSIDHGKTGAKKSDYKGCFKSGRIKDFKPRNDRNEIDGIKSNAADGPIFCNQN